MNKVELDDELRPEYDLKSLRVRKLGKERQKFGDLVRLEPDIIEAFPNAELVNAALRSLLEIAKRSTQMSSHA
jgi:RNA-binding protein YlmH